MSQPQLLARARAILLDFDGPVCSAFAGYPAPTVAADMLTHASRSGASIPEELTQQTDPMQVLRQLYRIAPDLHAQMEEFLTRAEVTSVGQAEPETGVVALLESCRRTHRPVVVVSNNSAEAVADFLTRHRLDHLVVGIHGRDKTSPRLMKPHPHLLELALRDINTKARHCLMVGDSTTDIEAAHAVGAMAAGYANKPGKTARFLPLGSDLIIHSMDELATALAVA